MGPVLQPFTACKSHNVSGASLHNLRHDADSSGVTTKNLLFLQQRLAGKSHFRKTQRNVHLYAPQKLRRKYKVELRRMQSGCRCCASMQSSLAGLIIKEKFTVKNKYLQLQYLSRLRDKMFALKA